MSYKKADKVFKASERMFLKLAEQRTIDKMKEMYRFTDSDILNCQLFKTTYAIEVSTVKEEIMGEIQKNKRRTFSGFLLGPLNL